MIVFSFQTVTDRGAATQVNICLLRLTSKKLLAV